jgi:hypothetical protein
MQFKTAIGFQEPESITIGLSPPKEFLRGDFCPGACSIFPYGKCAVFFLLAGSERNNGGQEEQCFFYSGF